MFAFLDARGHLVVKLPAERVDALVTEGRGVRWVPGRGRAMREWLAVGPANSARWLPLARDARTFVGSARGRELRARGSKGDGAARTRRRVR